MIGQGQGQNPQRTTKATATRRRRLKRRVTEIAINAQAHTSVRLLAEVHQGLTAKGYLIKPTVSDLVKTALEAVSISTGGVNTFATDSAALAYLRINSFVMPVPEEDLADVMAFETEAKLNIARPDQAQLEALIPAEMKGILTPEILQKLSELSEAELEKNDSRLERILAPGKMDAKRIEEELLAEGIDPHSWATGPMVVETTGNEPMPYGPDNPMPGPRPTQSTRESELEFIRRKTAELEEAEKKQEDKDA